MQIKKIAFLYLRDSGLMSFLWTYVEWQTNWVIKAEPLGVIYFTDEETEAQRSDVIAQEYLNDAIRTPSFFSLSQWHGNKCFDEDLKQQSSFLVDDE